MRENMEQHFNTPAEVIDNNMKAGEGKAHLPLGKMILLGIMAGAFIALWYVSLTRRSIRS